MTSRFGQVVTAHWPVFALLAAISAAMLIIARVTRSRPTADSVGRKTLVGWALLFLLPPLVYVAILADGFSVQASIFAALMAAAVLLWVFSLTEEFVGPLVAIVGALFVGLAPPDVALSGFSSPSLLLLVGVFALSATISSSGLSYRLILRMLLRLPDKPFWHQAALLMSGYALSPLVPSANARIALLTPPYKDMVSGLRLPARGPAITALLAAMFGGAALLSPMMVTSKSANIAAVNFLPRQLQAEFNGAFWLVAAAAAALTVTVAHLALLPRLFPPQTENPLPRADIRRKLDQMGPLRPAERIAAGCFLFFLVGSATVGWHHVNPPYLAGCVLLGLLLTGTLARKDFRSNLDWPQIFFLLGLDSMVRIMGYLGLQQALADTMRPYFDFVHGSIMLFILASLIVTLVVRLALPVTAGALTAVVILLPIATDQGINPWIAVFCAAVFSDIAFVRYQGTNGLIQLHSEGLIEEADQRGFARYAMLMNAARVAAVYASIPWWSLLGLL
jgi:di/tricarboxylate transporter